MRNVEIEIFQIARTNVEPSEVSRWLKHLGASEGYQDSIYEEGMNEDEITNPALLIAIAAKRCYMSFEAGLNPNVTKVRSDFTEYIDNILKSGHGSVLEHATYTFAIEGVSRVFTAEMNRHRAGVGISEGSMRYIRYDDIPSWLPTSITLTPEEEKAHDEWDAVESNGILHPSTSAEYQTLSMARKKVQSQAVFRAAYAHAEQHYAALTEIWADELAPDSKFAAKKNITSMMRRIIPMGVATGGVWTMNMRAVRHIMAMRASAAAEEEILHVFSRIAKLMVENEPMLCGDFSQTPEGYWAPKYPKV